MPLKFPCRKSLSASHISLKNIFRLSSRARSCYVLIAPPLILSYRMYASECFHVPIHFVESVEKRYRVNLRPLSLHRIYSIGIQEQESGSRNPHRSACTALLPFLSNAKSRPSQQRRVISTGRLAVKRKSSLFTTARTLQKKFREDSLKSLRRPAHFLMLTRYRLASRAFFSKGGAF